MSDDRVLDGSGKPVEVYVTKYALTEGIRKCAVEHWCEHGAVRVVWPGGLNGSAYFSRNGHEKTLEAAQASAKAMAAKKLASLDRQRARLEKVSRDGAKVVEEK